MAFISCPNCDTIHDVDALFFNGAARKVRCATCRTVWEAEDPTIAADMPLGMPKLDLNRPSASEAAPVENTTSIESDPAPPSVESTGDAASTDGPDISADELEALFAEPAPAASPASDAARVESPPGEMREFDPESLARSQDAAIAAAKPSAHEVEADRAARRARRLHASEAHHRHEQRSGARSFAVMLMAGGIATLATLSLFRNEVARVIPESAKLFAMVGLAVENRILDIRDVASTILRDGDRETLEISGSITNHSKRVQKIPVLRLSIRNAAGQDIYVWTAGADLAELAPGETTAFRRRLASPPQDSHSVMVRFVAKDDIVAAIR